jgi:hypothetical protein
MKPVKLAIAAGPLAALVLAAVPASASVAGHVHRVGSCTAPGDYAVCTAGGTINHPRSIHIHVWASPSQSVSGSWSMTCGKGLGAGSTSGNFNGTTTVRRDVRMPYRRPDTCSIAATAQLNGGGKIHVWITGRKA